MNLQTMKECADDVRRTNLGAVDAATQSRRGAGRTAATLLQALQLAYARKSVIIVALTDTHAKELRKALAAAGADGNYIEVLPSTGPMVSVADLHVAQKGEKATVLWDHAVLERHERLRIDALQESIREFEAWQLKCIATNTVM
ncbi:hypothetical protein SBWP25_0014 [Pseudomonas phage phi2]|uniref:Hypothetical phage protein n=1 Tax=Pseudomonas phage phi2 TaxID=1450169 RepID=D2EBR8_9CAUD|nr:hypothetical protein SBWP25_0014 [Pseudomonas phage phi-2]CBH51584.1 hypothetical phage protein [Pseudomonas phage phi-2]